MSASVSPPSFAVPPRYLAVLAALLLSPGALRAQEAAAPGPRDALGVNVHKPAALAGYTLVFPLRSTNTYLIDNEGRVVRTWESQYHSGQDAYLLENGHLLRSAHVADDEALFAGASQGGRIQEFTWDGELVWDFKFHDEKRFRHHAITPLPNGNVMMIVWERKTAKESIEAGVDPKSAGDGEMLVDSLVEIKPNGKEGGDIVWEWHIWDHLVQDHDSAKANYGDVAAHPELIDANYARARGGFFGNMARAFRGPRREGDRRREDRGRRNEDEPDQQATDDAVRRLQGIGYVGAAPRRGGRDGRGLMIPDWTHVNGVSYNAQLDQIMLSPREFNEVWIVDHSTTTEEAKGHTGGRYGKGGDLLYRWGNPAAYRAGGESDQRLFSQHDTHWIPEGLPGAGHMLVFNNGGGRPGGPYSSVDEIELPMDSDGNYTREPGQPFGPKESLWSYVAENPEDFNAMLMAGAQRLPNGNTLICSGFNAEIFEVTPEKEMVWKFVVPGDSSSPSFGPPGGFGRRGGFGPPPGFGPPQDAAPGGSVSLLPGPLRFFLRLTDEQQEKLAAFEKQASETFDRLLTAEQLEQLKKLRAEPGTGGAPRDFAIGKILTDDLREKLTLSDEQKATLDDLQKSASDTLAGLLDDAQKDQIKEMEEMAKAMAAGGGPNFGPPGRGPRGGGPNFGPPGRGRGGPGGFPGMGGVPGSAGVFRAYRYAADFPGLAGKDLTPGKAMTEIVKGPEQE